MGCPIIYLVHVVCINTICATFNIWESVAERDLFCSCFEQDTIQGKFCCQINNKSINQTCFPRRFISATPAYILGMGSTSSYWCVGDDNSDAPGMVGICRQLNTTDSISLLEHNKYFRVHFFSEHFLYISNRCEILYNALKTPTLENSQQANH